MSLALLSIAALVFALGMSVFSRLNPGLLGLVLAYLLGAGVLGLSGKDIAALFPGQILLTLVSLTLLFGHARHNGTLTCLTGWTVQLARGRRGVVPIAFFGLALLIGSMGAGNIGAVALLAPIALEVALELQISPFLMAVLVCCGGNGAAFSPVAPTGVIAHNLMVPLGLGQAMWHSYVQCLIAHAVMAAVAYTLLGGLSLLRRGETPEASARLAALLHRHRQPFARAQLVTLAALVGMLGLVLTHTMEVGAAALLMAIVLQLCKLGDDAKVLPMLPWDTILMVCGMSVLMGTLEKAGGLALCTDFLGRITVPGTSTGLLGLLTGALSAFSSSSGVVMPAFLPTIAPLAQQLHVPNTLPLADAINVGAHLVDVSPLSTLGALCVAAVPPAGRSKLYRQLLLWGLAMIPIGALYCLLAFRV